MSVATYEPVTSEQAACNLAELQRSLDGPPDVVRGEPSPYERRVLRMLAIGMTDGQICATLHVKDKTLTTYISNLKRAVRARNRTHLIATAIWHGWIDYTPELAEDAVTADRCAALLHDLDRHVRPTRPTATTTGDNL